MASRRKQLRSVGRLAVVIAIAIATAAAAETEAQEPSWNITTPRGETRTIEFTTDVGTWMSVDVSPDGAWIVFDLLSHIYRVPMAGGEAESLTQNSGIALNYHPRYSPDGRTIAFVSDRGGQSNVWLMDAEGRSPRPLFSDSITKVNEIAWTADGDAIVVVQSGGRDRGGVWKYPLAGGDGTRLLESGSWPSLSRDGRYLYYQARTGTVPRPGAGDMLAGLYQLRRLALDGGDVLDMTSGTLQGYEKLGSSGGAIAPEVSPDGRWLAFARRIPDGTISYKGHRFGPRSALWLRDLETGSERLVMDPIEQDMAEGVKVLRVLPGYAWTPDGRSIVLSQGGRIRRLHVATGDVETIPFTARVRRVITERVAAEFRIADTPFEARYLRWHTASPDAKRLAFQAVGKLWSQELPSGTPRRLTPDSFPAFEYAPAWSPDGRWLAFTTWDELSGGHVWKVSVGDGRIVRLSDRPAEYANPDWRADGGELVVARGSGATLRGRTMGDNPWFDVVRIPAAGGPAVPVVSLSRVSGDGGPDHRTDIVRPRYGADGRIFFADRSRDGPGTSIVSLAPDGGDRTVHATVPGDGDQLTISPAGQWVAFVDGGNVHIRTIGATSGSPPAARDTTPRPISEAGGLYPRWRDERTVEYGSANTYFTHDVTTGRTAEATVRLSVARDIPSGSIALVGARIVTMGDAGLVESGTIVVEGSRIRCVGDCPLAGVDRIVDVTGRTIVPGLVDTHAHHYHGHLGMIPARGTDNAVYLAYGITTALDPAAPSRDVFAAAELIDAGLVFGPRNFSTGESYGSSRNLRGFPMVEHTTRKLSSWGAVSSKQHGVPRREQQQWIAEAARTFGLNVTAEGSDLNHDLAMVMDGYTGIEHMLSYMPVYDDVARFFGRAGTCYNPTLLGAGPAAWDEDYFWARADVWKDETQRRWVAWRDLMGIRRRVLRPDTDYSFPLASQLLADILAEGGCGSFGGHFQQPGLATHWHLWAAAVAMGAHDALRTATMGGAEMLGLRGDIGSLEAGKLADLIVLNSNPLDDIQNTTDLLYVMKGGVLYDARSLDEVWPRARPFGGYPWLNPDVYRADDRPVDYWNPKR